MHTPRRLTAFTLIEMMIVIVIIGIMLASLIFMAGGQIRRMQFRNDYTLFTDTRQKTRSMMISSSALPPDPSLQNSDPNAGKMRKINQTTIQLEKDSKDITILYEYSYEGAGNGNNSLTYTDTVSMRNTTITSLYQQNQQNQQNNNTNQTSSIIYTSPYNESCKLQPTGIDSIQLQYLDKSVCYTIQSGSCGLVSTPCP